MGKYNFKKDLLRSDKNTEDLIRRLEEKLNINVISTNNDYKYDLLCESALCDRPFKLEVKEDFYCKKSGNVALEFESRGKPSGIATSEADYYLYIVHLKKGKKYLAFTNETLKRMIRDKLYFRIVCGGDRGSNTYNYLFKLEVFEGNADRILKL